MPAKAKAPTKKAEAIAGAKAALAKAQAMKDEDDEQQDDDSTNGAQSKLPAKAKSPTDLGGEHMAKEAHTWVATDIPVRTVGNSGEGSRQASETGEMDKRPEDNADAEASESGGKVAGKVKGKTLSLDGVPATAIAPCDAGGVHAAKNDGDAEIGKKGKGQADPGRLFVRFRRAGERTSRRSSRTPLSCRQSRRSPRASRKAKPP